uniref:Uncharacterized protein n=1 Tax=Romanomermis culicivorax TaxID=13658 RepID=A0A915ILB8_ROMCU
MLKSLMADVLKMAETNIKSGFPTCGIFPFDPEQVLKKWPAQQQQEDLHVSINSTAICESIIAVLEKMRYDKTTKPR